MSFKLGLVGFPLEHSYSRLLHNAALKSLNLEGSYQLWEIPPGTAGRKELTSRIQDVRDGVLTGFNVTIPYKETVLPLVDVVTPTARAAGAVNTLIREPHGFRVVGDNTDSPGFWTDLLNQFSEQGRNIPPSALVLGAGGAARAVIHALVAHNWTVAVAARRPAQAEELAGNFQHGPGTVSAWSLSSPKFPETFVRGLIINATPVGSGSEINRSPWPDLWSFPEGSAVYDLVYNPRETLFMKQARAQNLPARNGLGMLIEQAALAFASWTGRQPPRKAMQRAAQTLDRIFSVPSKGEKS